MKRLAVCLGWVVLAASVWADDALPPKPAQYITDGAGILSAQTVSALNAKLAEADRTTSNQVLVATFPSIPAGYVMEDFTQRTAEAWGVGQKDRDNGVVLFVFPNDRKMRIEVGYGLEGALPDAVAKRIISNVIAPAFRSGDFNGGVEKGVNAILQGIRGEYVAPSSESPREEGGTVKDWLMFLIFCAVVFIVVLDLAHRGKSMVYGPRGRRGWYSSWGGASSGGFGRSSGGGGGFSGGGGSFGGGGASGGW